MMRTGFNPLHCGAVVASTLRATPHLALGGVSIPFIAGQWSLPFPNVILSTLLGKFQSPSLRGSGRFQSSVGLSNRMLPRFQSPSLRGSGRFLETALSGSGRRSRFNPLHCGAVVASRRRAPRSRGNSTFQSPSLRGSGRFWAAVPKDWNKLRTFQSPSLRGSGRFSRTLRSIRYALRVSIPFIAGQWSLQSSASQTTSYFASVSIPFIAGQWSLPPGAGRRSGGGAGFQSPSLRGSGRFATRKRRVRAR